VAALAGAYEGASFGRRLRTWGSTPFGPNTELYGSLSALRSRTRELVRNNPYPDGALDILTANLIGSGITPRWKLEDEALRKEIHGLWARWVDQADADGACDFYGLQELVARSMIESGEVFVRFRLRRPEDGLSVPLQLQVLEADHLDETYQSLLDNGNKVRMGIEFDVLGRRVAYWFYADHPGETFLSSNLERRRIPAAQILHIYRKLRPGQIRGRPWPSSVITTLYELDQYEDAELVRKKTAAMFGGFITENAPSQPGFSSPLGQVVSGSGPDREVVALEPGTFPVLPPGMDVKFSEPADVGGNYERFLKQQVRKAAKGFKTTYEQISGDLEGVSYSSIRASLLEFHRFCRMIQRVLVFQLCKPVARMFMDAAVMAGAVEIPDYFEDRAAYNDVAWRPDGWEWVDPVKEMTADLIAVRAGFKTRAQVIAQRGGDIEDVDRETAEDNARADELGLVFDSDPRKTAKSGAMQAAEDAALQSALSGGD